MAITIQATFESCEVIYVCIGTGPRTLSKHLA